MPATPTYGLRYPSVTGPPNVPLDIQNLATDVEAKFAAVDAFANTAVGGEVVANAQQSLTNGAGVRLLFGATVRTPSGISWGSFHSFTTATAGVYSVYAQARKSIAAVGDAMAITGTTYSDATLIIPGMSTNGYGDVFVSGTRYFAAGTVLSAWYYSGSATANTITTRYPLFSVWRVG